ncbi:MAG TPA: recombinase family protein [Bauldia sp.]|nr:recombinase family protein [Bauldia sp.]
MKRSQTSAAAPRRLRCAVYTRKSSEEGLDQEFNSLDAQREACEAFAASQKAEGWVLLRDRYDDGGFSGGTLERPALKQLLADIEAGLIDVVVVYKIDRLSRSLMDFAKLVEVFDRKGVTFVSVTQSFNTTTSMGRLTLNILLSFAQFEREVIGERIRDKFAASRKRGMWMGGWAPLGYDVVERKLVVNTVEAGLVRRIFQRFVQLGSMTNLVRELNAEGLTNKRGKLFDKGIVYKLLNNRIYLGEAVHKGTAYPGEHAAIVDRHTFDKVHAILASNGRARAAATRRETPALLKGLIFTEAGRAMTPTHTRKGSRLYRYYVSTDALRGRATACTAVPLRLPADAVETAVVREIQQLVRAPEIVAQAVAAARREAPSVNERDVVTAINQFGDVWSALFPAEQARIVRLLVERVTVTTDGLAVDLRTEGLGTVMREMLNPTREEAIA